MKRQSQLDSMRRSQTTSPALIAIVFFLAVLVMFRVADMCGYLPPGPNWQPSLSSEMSGG